MPIVLLFFLSCQSQNSPVRSIALLPLIQEPVTWYRGPLTNAPVGKLVILETGLSELLNLRPTSEVLDQVSLLRSNVFVGIHPVKIPSIDRERGSLNKAVQFIASCYIDPDQFFTSGAGEYPAPWQLINDLEYSPDIDRQIREKVLKDCLHQ